MIAYAPDDRIIALQGATNFRDLGGYAAGHGQRVRCRRLFRSGSTDALTVADRAALGDLGIRTVVDLRSNRERLDLPHGLKDAPGINYLQFDHDRTGGNLSLALDRPNLQASHVRETMLHLYRGLPYELADIYRELFRKIAAGPLPLVFNCAAGKDRTGVAAALLLSVLGVSWEDVVTDYLLTEQFVPAIVRRFSGPASGAKYARFDAAVIAPVFEVRKSYLDAMRESVIARSGSIDEFVRGHLGLGPDVIDDFRLQLVS